MPGPGGGPHGGGGGHHGGGGPHGSGFGGPHGGPHGGPPPRHIHRGGHFHRPRPYYGRGGCLGCLYVFILPIVLVGAIVAVII